MKVAGKMLLTLNRYFCNFAVQMKKNTMENKITLRTGILFLLILLAAVSRLLPHPYNFTPIGAMALFGAAHFERRWLAFVLPLAAMWLSDLALNNILYSAYYDGFVWGGSALVYASFALIALLGMAVLRRFSWGRLLGSSLAASVIFFLVTNAGVWLSDPVYARDLTGLMASYAAGLPFFGNTLLGDLFYCGALFGGYAFLAYRFPRLQPAA